MQPTRRDGRHDRELRPVAIELGPQKNPEGSVLYRSGATSVLIACSAEDKVPPFLEGKGTGWILAGAAVLLGAGLGARLSLHLSTEVSLTRLRRAALFYLLSLGISGLLIVTMKPLVGRLRPRFLYEQGLYGFSPFNFDYGDVTFPSGHSQTAFAAMTALSLLWPRYAIGFYAFAVMLAELMARIVTSWALETLVSWRYALVLVRMMLVASAPAPLSATPVLAKPTATDAAVAVAVIVATSEAWRVMPPVAVTLFASLIEVSTRLAT